MTRSRLTIRAGGCGRRKEKVTETGVKELSFQDTGRSLSVDIETIRGRVTLNKDSNLQGKRRLTGRLQ